MVDRNLLWGETGPLMIEEAMVSHPAVAMAAAVGQPDAYAGELPVVYLALRPGASASVEELHEHARGVALCPNVDMQVIASRTPGFTGADLANVVNEAALLGARRGLTRLPMALFEEGLDRATLGVSSRGAVLDEGERRVVAYHEVGHALVARALPGATPAHRITIVPRGGALGHCTLIDTDRSLHSRGALLEWLR